MAGEQDGGFAAQMASWQSGQQAPGAGGTPPAADSPAPGPATPPAPAAGSPPAQGTPGAPGSPAPGSESPPTPGDQPPAATPTDSGAPNEGAAAPDPAVDKRVSDAQRKMHAATERARAAEARVQTALAENTTLRTQLQAVLSSAELQPVTAADFNVAEAIKGVITDYKKPHAEGGPKDDDEALTLLVGRVLDLGDQRATAKQLAAENTRRAAARGALVHQAVSRFVSEYDAELPLPVFWAMVPDAETETPAELRTAEKFQERLDWQVKRAIAKATALLEARADRTRETTVQNERTQRAAEVVMPGGGSAAPITPTKPGAEQPPTMVEQMEKLQAKAIKVA